MVMTQSTKRRSAAPRGAGDLYADLTLVVDDAIANDSDKTFVVPSGQEWEPHAIYVELTTTATVGNRVVTVRFLDGSGNVIARASAQIVQGASLSAFYTFGPRLPAGTSFGFGSAVTVPLPALALPAGYQIRVLDSTIVDAAADDMTVRILAQVRGR